MNIKVKISDNSMNFSIYKKPVDEQDVNNTNIIDITTMVFNTDYFTNNNELICSFLNTIVIKKNIHNITIKNNEIAHMVLDVTNNIKSINNVCFKENEKIPYDVAFQILKSNYIEYVECFNMDYFMFDEINTRTNIKIKLMDETMYFNNFMDKNDLNTYSKIFYKKTINIENELTVEDIEYLEMFFNLNNNLNIVNLYSYDNNIINILFNLISKYKKYNIKIVIHQNRLQDVKECLDYIKKYEKLKDKYKMHFNVKYSKEYISKNILKQINLNIAKLLILIVVICIIVVIILNMSYQNDSKEQLEYFNELETNTVVETVEDVVTKEDDDEVYYKVYHTAFDQNYDELIKMNKETVGWLKVKNTNINFPIVQHSDNTYYLRHTIKNNYNYFGWAFADYRDNFDTLSKNTIIYGHSNKLGIVFGTLRYVLQPSWYKNTDNQIINFDIKGKSYKFQIFSIYTIPVTNDYLIVDFDDESFTNYINMVSARSIYNFNVNVNSDDKIITLSTCYPTTTQRLVVHAKSVQ